jgi:phenylalanyl-tRNA synthetase alpha chain
MQEKINATRDLLIKRLNELENKADILKAPELKELYGLIAQARPDQKREIGQAVNAVKTQLEQKVADSLASEEAASISPIDVTAPFDINTSQNIRPRLLPVQNGTAHPLMTELERVVGIFTRMGFAAVESRQLDSDFHMFEALNFPEDHPARDAYDTFRTEEGLIPPAHTSTMQHRILKAGKKQLEAGEAIACISYGRCFRNEDLDATHEHTFYQVEGVFVSETATLGHMLGTLRSFFEAYYGQKLKIKTQPAYFPFVEPGLEFAIEKPKALGGKPGDWLEMLGCGMIHPNVLSTAGIDPAKYRGFAWGGGVERLAMLAYGIEDLRHFKAGKLNFLRKFR